MVKERPGYRTLFAQIPEILWTRLDQEAAETGESIAQVLTGILQRRYRVGKQELPGRKRQGRPRKT